MAGLILGTRGSALARTQAEMIRSMLSEVMPEAEVVTEIIKTSGDKIVDAPLSRVGGKGFFTKEIEDALLSKKIDLAVHSLKDLPVESPDNLYIAAVTQRVDPRDVLITKTGCGLIDLSEGATLGTASLRRQAQLRALRPDLRFIDLRGNLDTRLRKLQDSDALDGIVVAAAGMIRMNLQDRVTEFIEPSRVLPAPGQGALAVQVRENDSEAREIVSKLDHQVTHVSTAAERTFLDDLGGGCQVPVGALAVVMDETLNLLGRVCSLDGSIVIEDQISGEQADAEKLGSKLASTLISKGADRVLSDVRHQIEEEMD